MINQQKMATVKPTVSIEYCPKCGWMLRAAYMAQELLSTFTDELHGVLLQPSEVGGSYIVSIDGVAVFDRKEKGRFPEIKELKQIVRDIVSPEKSLGHSDKTT
jgi:selenoprotein W-related protein